MKANLTDDGVLILDAETGVEAFALQQWLKRMRLKGGIEVRYQYAGSMDGFDAINKALRSEMVDFRKWQADKANSRLTGGTMDGEA